MGGEHTSDIAGQLSLVKSAANNFVVIDSKRTAAVYGAPMRNLSVKQFAEEWDSGSGGRFCTAGWAAGRKKLLKRLIQIAGDLPLAELQPQHFWQVQRQVAEDGRTVGTGNRITAAMMAFVRDAEGEELLPEGTHHRFSRKVRYRRDNPVRRFLPWNTEQRAAILQLVAEHQPHWLLFVEFQFSGGLRVSEAIALDWPDVDLEKGFVRITKSFSQGRHGNCKTPRSVRLLPLTAYMRERLASTPLAERHGPVFKTPRGCRINENNFSQRIWAPTIALAAGTIPKRPPRCSRHTFTSIAVEQDTPMPDLARLTGDRIEMLERRYHEYTKEFRLLDVDTAVGPIGGRAPLAAAAARGIVETFWDWPEQRA